jgi:hypothetical protein
VEPEKPSFFKKYGPWILNVIWLAILAYWGLSPAPILPPLPEEDVGVPEGYATGWVHDPLEVAEVLTAPDAPGMFTDTPAFKDGPEPQAVYLWQVYPQVTGAKAPSKNQRDVGSCVSFGTNTAIERTIANAIAAGRPGQWKRVCEEVTYGGSRVEIGGGRLRGDGSVGAWAAKFVQRYGIVTREVHGQYDLTEYDTRRCREFGSRGVPTELEAVAKQHPVGAAALVRSWPEIKKANSSGYGVAVCSGQGFSMQRDARGVARARGTWMHCMCIDGYHKDTDGREYGHVTNSWGANAHSGPVGWGDPGTDGFWAEARILDRMAREGDTWAFSDTDGFPVKPLAAPATKADRRKGVEFPLFALAP